MIKLSADQIAEFVTGVIVEYGDEYGWDEWPDVIYILDDLADTARKERFTYDSELARAIATKKLASMKKTNEIKLTLGELKSLIREATKRIVKSKQKTVEDYVAVEFVCPTQGMAQHVARELKSLGYESSWNIGRGGYVVNTRVPSTFKVPRDWTDEQVRVRLLEGTVTSAPSLNTRVKVGDHVNVTDFYGDTYKDAVVIQLLDDVQDEMGDHHPVKGPGFKARVEEKPFDMVFANTEIDTTSPTKPPSERKKRFAN